MARVIINDSDEQELFTASNPGQVAVAAGSAAIGKVDANAQVGDTDVSASNPVPSSGFMDLIEVTLTLDTDAYTSGDVLADVQEIANAFPNGNPAVLYSLQVLDEDDQALAMDVLFLRSEQSIGTENAGFSPSDAVAREILTEVPILAADYNDYTNSQQAIKQVSDTGMGVVLKPTTGTSLYVAVVTRGAPTHSANGVRLRVGLIQAG